MGEIVIRVNGRIIERTIYILIILILGVLLLFSYLGDGASDKSSDKDAIEEASLDSTIENTDVEVEPIVEPVKEPEVIPTFETCDDGIKNQDETAIDCGGSCTTVNGKYWYDDACHKTAKLSGEMSFKITEVNEEKSPTSDAVKIKSIKVQITNGLEDSLLDGYLEIYAKSTSGILLNQYTDVDVPYALITLPTIKSGATYSGELDVSGSYLNPTVGYSIGDDFKIEVKLYDEDDDLKAKDTESVKV